LPRGHSRDWSGKNLVSPTEKARHDANQSEPRRGARIRFPCLRRPDASVRPRGVRLPGSLTAADPASCLRCSPRSFMSSAEPWGRRGQCHAPRGGRGRRSELREELQSTAVELQSTTAAVDSVMEGLESAKEDATPLLPWRGRWRRA
jgi:hypothetical protein